MSMDKDNHSDELRGAVLHALIERGQSPLDTRLAQQAAGAHPAPCARHCEATAFRSELRRLQSENEQLRAGYDAARLEIASLQAQLEALASQAQPVWVVPFALLVRKKSWNEGQWECAPSGCPEYGRQWADERVWVYTAPQPAAQAAECGNCFEGKSDMDHDCRKCGGTGAAQALDALKKAGAIAVSAAKTNSRDIADWREDMDRIAAIAAQQGGA